MGKNLIAHLRSNLVFRVPRAAIPGLSATTNELQTSALFVKGRATRANGDLIGRFHLQIAASGGGNTVGGEDELFRKVPDVDFYDQLRSSTDTHVAFAIRGLGEMERGDPTDFGAHPSRVDLDPRTDEYGVRRASVTLTPTSATTISGPRWMPPCRRSPPSGARPDDPASSVRDGLAPLITKRERCGWVPTRRTASPTRTGASTYTENLYAAGPALFPEHRFAQPDAHRHRAVAPHRRSHHDAAGLRRRSGFEVLFDGTSLGDWTMSTISNQPGRNDPGDFPGSPRGVGEPPRDGSRPALAHPADAGALCASAAMDDERAGRQFRRVHRLSGSAHEGYDNTAYVGVNFGFEIQIDELARPDNAPIHRTGAIYSFKGPTDGPPSRIRSANGMTTRSPSMAPTSRSR